MSPSLLTPQSELELSDAMNEYHSYVNHIINQIIDFDIWFEQSNARDFPKEWYTFIKKQNENFVEQ